MSIKSFENEIYVDFARRFPSDADKSVDWSLFDKTQILIELNDGRKVLYDNMDKTCRSIRNVRSNEENNEERWRYEFSQRLRKKMQLRSIGQDELSNITGISRPMISRYASGQSIPSLYNAEKIAKALRCSITELVRFPR